VSNELYYGDNLEIIRNHIKDESVDLIYLDPPFNSNRDYNVIYDNALAQTKAFGDTWSQVSVKELRRMVYEQEQQRYSAIHSILDGLEIILYNAQATDADKSMYAYLLNMGVRLVELHRVLKDTGSIYLHCDPTAGHYLKILMDAIFGRKNFRNEIVWCYASGGVSRKYFGKKHDIIFFYAKDKEKYFFNTQYRPYSEGTMQRGLTNYKKNLNEKYELKKEGATQNDWWSDITPLLSPTSKERLGYPTQKPVALLDRIIQASCPQDGIVLDPYCGCGTTVASASNLGRRWIGIDITYVSIDLIQQRLIDNFYLGSEQNPTDAQKEKARMEFIKDTRIFGIPRDLESARKLARETKGDYVRKEFEKWAAFSVGGVYSEKKGADGGVDGYFYIYDINEQHKALKKTCYIQVKSGKVGVKDIRDFDSTLSSLKAPIGIFVTLEEPTKPMLEYAKSLSSYQSNMGRIYDRITIITIEQILQDDVPDFAVRVTKRAQSVQAIQDSLELL
jgi:DNA modification methylase